MPRQRSLQLQVTWGQRLSIHIKRGRQKKWRRKIISPHVRPSVHSSQDPQGPAVEHPRRSISTVFTSIHYSRLPEPETQETRLGTTWSGYTGMSDSRTHDTWWAVIHYNYYVNACVERTITIKSFVSTMDLATILCFDITLKHTGIACFTSREAFIISYIIQY